MILHKMLILMLRYSVLFLFILLSSCGARKVAVNKTDTVIKLDSTSTINKETISTQDNRINIVTDIDELEIIPIDTTKHIEIDGKKYKNVKLRYKKIKKVLSDTTKIKVSEKASVEVKLKKDTNSKTFKKDIDKKESFTVFWWWLLIILLVILFFYTYKRLNKTLL